MLESEKNMVGKPHQGRETALTTAERVEAHRRRRNAANRRLAAALARIAAEARTIAEARKIAQAALLAE